MGNAPWQVTATKVYCEAVRRDTIIIVNKDWDCSCTYYGKWGPAVRLKRKGPTTILSRLGMVNEERRIVTDECKGPVDCPNVHAYLHKLVSAEET